MNIATRTNRHTASVDAHNQSGTEVRRDRIHHHATARQHKSSTKADVDVAPAQAPKEIPPLRIAVLRIAARFSKLKLSECDLFIQQRRHHSTMDSAWYAAKEVPSEIPDAIIVFIVLSH